MEFLSYNEYTEKYAEVEIIPKEYFDRMYKSALAEIEALSFGKICADNDETVQRAACIIAEGLYMSQKSGRVSSESNDGFSQSFISPNETLKNARRRAKRILKGAGLLYAGVKR